MLVILICCILLDVSNSYFLSPIRLTWDAANNYCIKHCNSTLAVIHSIHDFESAKFQSQQDPLINLYSSNNNQNVWIGLKSINQNEWIDGSSLNFTQWATNQPNSNKNCVQLSMEDEYNWINMDCTTDSRFLCTSCDSQLSKYMVIQKALNWSMARNYCISNISTDLASLHNQRDFEETISILDILSSFNWGSMYIGLNDIAEENKFVWSDGTSFDFANNISGGIYPWIQISGFQGDPNDYSYQEDCVQVLYNYYKQTGLGDGDCNWKDIFICNMPSQLCYIHIIQNDDDHMQFDRDCTWYTVEDDKYFEAILYEKQWINNNNILIIEYMFTITAVSNDWSTGIYIYNFIDNNNRYEIGITANNTIFIHQNNNHFYQKRYTQNALKFGKYYLLHIEVINGNKFNIKINGILLLTAIDNDTPLNRISSSRSGYIGIFNLNAAITAQSLYVSGEVLYEKPSLYTITTTTVSPINEATLPFEFEYGVVIIIIFEYKSINNISTDEIDKTFTNITRHIIDEAILEDDDINTNCILLNDYDIHIKEKIINKDQIDTIINSTVFVCNKETVKNLTFIFKRDLMEEFEKEIDATIPSIILDKTIVQITSIDDINIATTETVDILMNNDNIPRSESIMFWNVIIIIASAIGFCICVLCIICIYMIKKANKENKDIATTTTTTELSKHNKKRSTPGSLYRIDSVSRHSRVSRSSKHLHPVMNSNTFISEDDIEPQTNNTFTTESNINIVENVMDDININININITPGGGMDNDDDDDVPVTPQDNDDNNNMDGDEYEYYYEDKEVVNNDDNGEIDHDIQIEARPSSLIPPPLVPPMLMIASQSN